MAVHDTCGGWFKDAGFRSHEWFEFCALGQRDKICWNVFNGLAEFVDLDEFFPLPGGLGNNPFACVAIGDRVTFAECIEQVSASNTQRCLQGSWAIVETCMYDLGISLIEIYWEDGPWDIRTSEFLALVSSPTRPLRSRRRMLVSGLDASWRAIARPTAPPPITWS